jgi:predicted amidohydrolase YtcJ
MPRRGGRLGSERMDERIGERARIFANGSVFTGLRDRPWDEAVAVRGADVIGTGSLEDLRRDAPGATEVDVAGGTVVPGFVDAHNHFLSTGESLASIDLRYPGVDSGETLLSVVRAAAATTAHGETISGFGFDHRRYALPGLERLDAAAGDHPLHLFHTSGHHVLVNSRVLREAGVHDDTVDPPGGRFDRDADGRLTGLCLDTACGLVLPTDVEIGSHGPNFHVRAPLATLVAAVARADTAYVEAGLTCVADAQVTARELRAYREARGVGALRIRTVCMPLSHQLEDLAAVGIAGPFGDDRLSLGHLKVYADGTLTGGTAAFRDDHGIRTQVASFFHQPAELVDLIRRAWAEGWRVAVHAQGDLAISLVLDGFEAGAGAAPRDDARPRIEHAGFPMTGEIDRMRALGVIAVNQPTYLFDYGDEYLESLGELAHELQPWRDELEAGVRVVISSDSDVASYRPLMTIANAMRRRTRTGTVLGKRHRLSLDEALFAHTLDAALAVGLDHRVGSLEPGTAADLTIVSEDLRRLTPDEIAEVPVAATVIAGETVFERP